MRRRFVRSETAGVRVRKRKLYDSESDEDKITISRVRVFPSMPSVGTRRSTRVFVPKSVVKAGDADAAAPARVLRSGKRLESAAAGRKLPEGGDSEDEWVRWWRQEGFGSVDGRDDPSTECGRAESDRRDASAAVAMEKGEDLDRRRFGIVYNRKRWKSMAGIVGAEDTSSGPKDRMYGIPFVRKQRRKILDTANESSENSPLSGHSLNADDFRAQKGNGLIVFVGSSWSNSRCFSLFLVSVLGWMRHSVVGVLELASFLSSGSVAGAFACRGIRFLPVIDQSFRNPNFQCPEDQALVGSVMNGRRRQKTLPLDDNDCKFIVKEIWMTKFPSCSNSCGICIFFGARQFTPLLSLNFAAIPSYFMSLHSSMSIRSHFHPSFLKRFSLGLMENSHGDTAGCEEHNAVISSPALGVSRSEIMHSGVPKRKESFADCIALGSEMTAGDVASQQSVEFRKHQKRRTSLRSARFLKNSLDLQIDALRSESKRVKKLNLAASIFSGRDGMLGHGRGKSLDACVNELFGAGDDSMGFSSPRCKHGQKKFRSMPSEKIRELKLALEDTKQNIDSARCHANILVIESDRCWREDGAEVMLECSGSKEWLLAVKSEGITRFLHKAQEMRPSTFNRYTHAMMWTSENGWKLEFSDRLDWVVFKELHKECCERNAQAASIRTIPVPVVQEVSGYGDGESVPFVRPDMYISMRNSEVERALISSTARYDMDSEDEEWLKRLNYNACDVDNGIGNRISEDEFEKIMFSLEKTAYCYPDDVSEKDNAIGRLDLDRDIVSPVYDYWLRKRKEKKLPLIRVFQVIVATGQCLYANRVFLAIAMTAEKCEIWTGAPPKRTELIQKPSFRKKRSFKRQASQVGRGKPPFFLQAGAKQDAMRRVQDAEQAASNAMETAVQKRRKAQMLMQISDLATYKAVMALKLAESAAEAESAEAASMILD
ncbi:hypothetical protein ACLOJK_031268 [Asimina triloba]